MGADVTEFRLSFGRAYLAPVYDFGSAEIVAHSIAESPGLAQQEEMLGMLVKAKPEGAAPVVQSDMGWRYQRGLYVFALRENGFVQSMSRKGSCLDNSCTEGMFGHLKDEFSRGRDLDTFEAFKADLEDYIHHWSHVRRQKSEGPDPGRVPGAGSSGGRVAAMIYRVQVLGRSSRTPGEARFCYGAEESWAARVYLHANVVQAMQEGCHVLTVNGHHGAERGIGISHRDPYGC